MKHQTPFGLIRSQLALATCVLSLLLSFQPAYAQSAYVGEFSVSMEVKDFGRNDLVLEQNASQAEPSYLQTQRSKTFESQALVELTESGVLRLSFTKPVVLPLTHQSEELGTINRMIPKIEIELGARQINHFQTLFLTPNADLVATMDVLDYELNLEVIRDLAKMQPKDFIDGNFFRLPVISKPLKALHLPFINLDDLLKNNERLKSTSVEVHTLEVSQINPQNHQLTTREHRVVNLAETMAGLYSQSPETQALVQFRSSAFHGRNNLLDSLGIQRTLTPMTPDRSQATTPKTVTSAQILTLKPSQLRCRHFLRANSGSGASSKGQTAEIIPFTR